MQQVFVYPPLYGSLLLHELPDFHAIHNPSHAFYVFRSEEQDTIHEISHLDFSRAVHRSAQRFSHLAGETVGLMPHTDIPIYNAVFLGIMKAGCVPLLLSPRNSAIATAKLLEATKSHTLITTPAHFQVVIEGIQDALNSGDPDYDLVIEQCPLLHDLYPDLDSPGQHPPTEPFTPYQPLTRAELHDVAYCLHTSGSTGFPKVVSHSHLSILQWASLKCMMDVRDYPGNSRLRISGTMLPSFHIYGINVHMLLPLATLSTIAIPPPQCTTSDSSPFTPSPGSVLQHTVLTKCNILATLPAMLILWDPDTEALAILKSMVAVWYAGGGIPTLCGTKLHQQGVRLVPIYGSTELGAITHTLPAKLDSQDGDWAYIRFDSNITIHWLSHGDGLFQPHFLATEKHQISARNTLNGLGFTPSDLLMRHPTKLDLWKVADRIDNVLVMPSGEKLVPGPMEDIINTCPIVQNSMVFGAGRLYTGVIIQRKSSVSELDDESCTSQAWPFIQHANDIAPAFGRIFRNMIIVAPASKQMLMTAKGTVVRSSTLELFKDEIDGLYRDTLSSNQIKPPQSWTQENILKFLKVVTEQLRGQEIVADRDIFEQGFDSLHARLLWQYLITAIKSSPESHVRTPEAHIKWEIIYANPTLVQLSQALHAALNQDETVKTDQSSDISVMKKLYAKYSTGLTGKAANADAARVTPAETVLLTGSTGSLGAHILVKLVEDPRIQTVYCLNRPSISSTQIARHEETFKKQYLNVETLKSSKVILLDGDGNLPQIGLDRATYHKLSSTIDTIIHCAWTVNFVQKVSSFESNLKSTRALIDLALQGTHTRFIFASSISSAWSWDVSRGPVPEAPIDDWTVAEGAGYGESKYVTERLLLQSGLHGSILRFGQLCGGTQHGTWPIKEWFPILVKSSVAIGALPQLSGAVAWVPTDSAAQCTIDVAMSSAAENVLNVVHPRRTSWTDIVSWVQRSLIDAEIVKNIDPMVVIPASDWLSRLEERMAAAKGQTFDQKLVREIPALELLDFFRNIFSRDLKSGASNMTTDTDIGGKPVYSTKKVEEISTTMRDMSSIGREDVKRWIAYWKSAQFLQARWTF